MNSSQANLDPLVDQIISQYQREYDYYQRVAQNCQQQCEAYLESNGIRALVTSRAKRHDRFERKIRKRTPRKNYQTIQDIYDDIMDLSGVRIALYFPGDRDEVRKIIKSRFEEAIPPKTEFNREESNNKPRFSGYSATHYFVKLKPETLAYQQHRYCKTIIEIQVASVLMHAWAEVDHDLVYKPLQGEISEGEYQLLDQINGLVIAGEIALEQLQKALETRVKGEESEFNNHYELASYLFEIVTPNTRKSTELAMGRIDILFGFLKETHLDTPKKMAPFLKGITTDTEKRPLTDQIVDRILIQRSDLYPTYTQVRRGLEAKIPSRFKSIGVPTITKKKAIGEFLVSWIKIEHILTELVKFMKFRVSPQKIVSPRIIRRLNILDDDSLNEIESLRMLRNNLVHGIEIPQTAYIMSAARTIDNLIERIRSQNNPEVKHIIEEVLRRKDTIFNS